MNSNHNFSGLTIDQFNIVCSCFPLLSKLMFFGSRVRGNFREHSDLDICVLSNLSRNDIAIATEKLEESKLPFTVDVVLYKDCAPDFQNIINSTGVMVKIT